MSVFNKIISAHIEKKTQAEQAVAAAQAAKTTAEKEFAKQFLEQSDLVAKPVFQAFAEDATAHGFPAIVEATIDGYSNPMLQIRMVPEIGAQLGTNGTSEIIFWIRGIISELKVEHASYYDQRPNKNGVNKQSYGIQSINAPVIERGLGEFLSSALKARNS